MTTPRLITWSRDPRELVAGMRRRAQLLSYGFLDGAATASGEAAVAKTAEIHAWRAIGMAYLEAP